MSFQEKSAWVLIVVTAIVGTDYVLGLARGGGMSAEGEVFPSIIIFVVLVALIHTALAVINPKETDASDERDREIERRGEVLGSYTLVGFVLFILATAMIEGHWLIANVAFLGLMISELIKNVWQVTLYRRSA